MNEFIKLIVNVKFIHDLVFQFEIEPKRPMTQFHEPYGQRTQRTTTDLRRRAELSEAALGELIAAGAVSSLHAVCFTEGDSALYCIEATLSESKGRLSNARGGVRTFSSLDSVASVVRRLGGGEFIVHLNSNGKTSFGSGAPWQ